MTTPALIVPDPHTVLCPRCAAPATVRTFREVDRWRNYVTDVEIDPTCDCDALEPDAVLDALDAESRRQGGWL